MSASAEASQTHLGGVSGAVSGDFVKEDSMFGGGWVPVGRGSGSYIRVQTYQHVGTGYGDYDKEEITPFAGFSVGFGRSSVKN